MKATTENRGTILIVDDDASVLVLIQNILVAAGSATVFPQEI